jgi:hypothetical protein
MLMKKNIMMKLWSNKQNYYSTANKVKHISKKTLTVILKESQYKQKLFLSKGLH